MVAEGEEYDLVNSSNGWTCILINGQNGYVKSDYVDIRFKVEYASSKQSESTEESTSSSEESSAEDSSYSESSYSESSSSSSSYDDDDDDDYSSSSSSESSSSQSTVSVTNDGISSTKQALVNYALQFVGNPYVYGGESLTNGTDCSGFTMLVYREFGISIPHGATSQSYYGTPISVDDVEPGDLLFYTDDEGGYGHVTMYIGNGQVVHASTPSTGIIISSMDYRTPAAARRLMD
jgi:cell wall-associated NlpC family hydrolase